MPESSQPPRPTSTPTWIGIFIALFGILIVRQAIAYFFPTLPTVAVICRESLDWLCAIVVLFIVKKGEYQPLTSIGIGTSPIKRSLLHGALLTVVCGVVGFGIAVLTQFKGGPSGESLARLPIWLLIMVVTRAGIVEELFYRGYAIERLEALGLNRYWAAAIPLFVFSLGHWTGGWRNIVIAFALGAVLSGSYLWRRDLVANMIGHFAVDFIGVVLPRLLSHP
jgi:membrane protease YdiL (CAAX protease family)